MNTHCVTENFSDQKSEQKPKKPHRGTLNLIPFKPGQSGNPGGRPKGRAWATDLRDKLAKAVKNSDVDRQDALIEGMLKRAERGDRHAIALIADILGERAPVKSQVDGTLNIADVIKRARERAKESR